MRIDGDHEHRADLLDRTKEIFDESSRTKAVLRACEHARQDERAKEEAVEWMAQNLPPEQAEELAQILSTSTLQIEIETETHVGSLD
jgi:hypothetical protein